MASIKTIIQRYSANALEDISLALERLEADILNLHEQGKHDEADNLEAEYERLQYQADQLYSEGEAVEEQGEPEDFDESGLEDFFAKRYRDWLVNPELTTYQDLVDGLRSQAEREQYNKTFAPKGFNATDEQLFEAAKDAYEALIKRQKRSSMESDLDSMTSKFEAKYPGLNLYIHKTFGEHRYGDAIVHIDTIVLPKEMQNQGIGTEVLETITRYADQNNIILTLSPDPSAGGGKDTKVGKKRLIELYKRFWFVPNTGRKKDYSLGGMFGLIMYRYPNRKLLKQDNMDKFSKSLDKILASTFGWDYKGHHSYLLQLEGIGMARVSYTENTPQTAEAALYIFHPSENREYYAAQFSKDFSGPYALEQAKKHSEDVLVYWASVLKKPI